MYCKCWCCNVLSIVQVEHERLWDSQRFTQTQLKVVMQQWQRDLEELLARALVTLQEAKDAHLKELQLHRDRRHQQEICLHLREKVNIPFTPSRIFLTLFFS